MSVTGGCTGTGTSHRPGGAVQSEASAPENPGATPSDPFHVAEGGTVAWSGLTPVAFTDHHWFVQVDGVRVRSGGAPNASHTRSAAGIVKVSSFLPSWLGLTGTFYVNGEISGIGGTCTGALYVDVTGDPATGLLMWVGVVFVLGGLAILYWARPRRSTPLVSVPGAGGDEEARSGSASHEEGSAAT